MKDIKLGLAAVALSAVLMLVAAEQASSAPQCDERGIVIKLLADKYKELPIAIGVTNNGGLVEVLKQTDGHTWSIIVTTPDGQSCLVAAGEGWRNYEPRNNDTKL
jgi:hypothetical protein